MTKRPEATGAGGGLMAAAARRLSAERETASPSLPAGASPSLMTAHSGWKMFNITGENKNAVDSCLAAACSAVDFDIAEVWSFGFDPAARPPVARTASWKVMGGVKGAKDSSGGGARRKVPKEGDVTSPAERPVCRHVYARPSTTQTISAMILQAGRHDPTSESRNQEHTLSPLLFARAWELDCPLWYTSQDEDTPLHQDLPLNSALSLPIKVESMQLECMVIFFSLQVVPRSDAVIEFMSLMSRAAVLAVGVVAEDESVKQLSDDVQKGLSISDASGSGGRVTMRGSMDLSSSMALDSPTKSKGLEHRVAAVSHMDDHVDTNVSWSELKNVEYMVNGSRCTIYTAVYKGQNAVVKLLRKDKPDAEIVRRELEMEMALLMRIKSDHVVKLLGAGSQPERFLIIERLDGGTLAQRCGNALDVRDRRGRFKKPRPFNYTTLLKAGRQLALALRHLHEEAIPGKMVLHRDLKPDNVGFTVDGDLKLLDLGLSKAVPKSELDNAVFHMTGETGSLRYMAPEVAESRPYNEKSDVHSFGMVLWEMASMRKPFQGMSRDDFYSHVVRKGIRPKIKKKWPRSFSDLLVRCWAEDFNSRPTCAEICGTMALMIQEVVDHSPLGESPRDGSGHGKLKGRRGRGLLQKLGLKDRHSMWF